MSDSPQFRYTTLGKDDGAVAGIEDAAAFLPEQVPSHWRIYFAVADTDAAVARVGELGGRCCLRSPTPTTAGWHR